MSTTKNNRISSLVQTVMHDLAIPEKATEIKNELIKMAKSNKPRPSDSSYYGIALRALTTLGGGE